MDPFSLVLLFAAAGIALWLWHINRRTRAIIRERRATMAGSAGFSGGDTGGQGGGVDGGSAGHADGGACGMDGGGGGHC